MNKFEQFARKPAFSLFGILGALTTLIGCLISAIAYRGPLGQQYSMQNYFISELGGVNESELAIAFNLGTFIGGLLMTIFLAGLTYHFTSKIGKMGSIVGIFSGICGALVGVFPFDVNIMMHGMVAMGFFYGGMFTVILYTIAIFKEKDNKLPKILGVFGLIGAVIFAIFNFTLGDFAVIFSGSTELSESALSLEAFRPTGLWWLAVFEWLSLLSVIFWIFLTAICLIKVNKKAE